jgi:aminoglycoside phosphotransferase family enzyme/predicted kinase
MIAEDQREVIQFLTSPDTHAGLAVERVDTHASTVFLAGTRAWKLKRAVQYDYLDFSTADRRRAMCEAEVRVNRRTAPALYRRVVAVTRQPDGSLALGGTGTPVDWVVEMTRFDQDQLLDRLATRGRLDIDLMRPLASAIARFHHDAQRRPDHGGASGMAWVVDGNALGFGEQGAGILDPVGCARLTVGARDALERHHRLLDGRRRAGWVRECHGDLHLRNIVLLDGRPTLFDGIEFNDELSCIDVAYDLAFLLMDLWRRELPGHANALWNGYLFETGDMGGIPLLPLFLSCRAAVRAKTSATAARLQSDPRRAGELRASATEYLQIAQWLLDPPPPCLIAIGGFSGSGKSTLARAIAHRIGAVPGALVIRSDETRKQVCGVDLLRRLGPEGYTADVTHLVYATILDRAAKAVRSGHAAIVDAVYARTSDRDLIERAAEAAGVPFVGLWLDVPEGMATARATARGPEASDADAAVIRRQVVQGTGPLGWQRIDASHTAAVVAQRVTAILRDRFVRGVIRPNSHAA